ncbi:MAG TPA: hypothetical protein VM658_14595 [bacterium]|nr:hypothetical protein [bacterium]
MPLNNGDYRALEDKIVATLLADTGEGGLREGSNPPVRTILAGGVELARPLAQAEFPAVLVRAVAKKETPAAPAYAVIKTFTISAVVLDRGLDRAAVEGSVRKISARLESVLRAQTATDRQFLGLPDLIEGAEGVLVSTITETRLLDSEAQSDRITARAVVEASIQVPCAFRYE